VSARASRVVLAPLASWRRVSDEQNASEGVLAGARAPALQVPVDLWATGDFLARAFAADPLLCHAEPDAVRRSRWMALLFRALGLYAAATGGVALAAGRGAALWLQNQTQPPFWKGLLYGSLRVMFALGWRATWRCMRHEAWCAARVRKLGFERYGYVWVLGVDPVAQRTGHGRRALWAALEAMRARDHRICLLKTESAANVGYYQKLGFELIDECLVPPTQLRYWLFRRELGGATPGDGR
jgi:ribosomal protein S18 acetylase RimI-like enzyme